MNEYEERPGQVPGVPLGRVMGADLVKAGKCPLGYANLFACIVCEVGHLTECHYPLRCHEAGCSHMQYQGAVL